MRGPLNLAGNAGDIGDKLAGEHPLKSPLWEVELGTWGTKGIGSHYHPSVPMSTFKFGDVAYPIESRLLPNVPHVPRSRREPVGK